MINTARNELRDALARRVTAEGALESARQASARGRALIETIAGEIEAVEEASMRTSSSLAAEMRAAITRGGAPSVATNDREMAKSDLARTALDARRQAAEQVVAELAAEEREHERDVSDATAAVERAVHDVLRVEAEKIAASWEEVELKARAIRIKLGGRSGDPIWRVSGLSDRVGRALYQNGEDREFDRPQSEIARGPWTDFAAALLRDSDAELDFAAADRAIEEVRKERAERRAADERLIARMRAEAA
jgi:hypothetical protein